MFSIKENNWLGRGVEFSSTLDLTEETISGTIFVNNPNYNYSGNSVYSSLNVSSSDKTDSSGYKNSITGFVLGSDKIYSITLNGYLIISSAESGQVEYFVKIGHTLTTSPIISNGSIYILTENSRIFGFN